jgi:Holliday junction resolvasome RuvABC endonuclease subunit
MPQRRNTILALDPGLRELGYAVFAGGRLGQSGVLPLHLLPRHRRLPEARRQLRAWVRSFKPRGLVIEQTHHHPVPWLDDLFKLTGTAIRLAKRRRMRLALYAPQTVRKSLVGNGWATKREVAAAVAARYPALRIYLTQDRKWKERYWQNMFDAIALGLHHRTIHQPPSRGR